MSEEAAYRELFLSTARSFLDARLCAKLKPTSRNLLWIVNYCRNRVRRTQGMEPTRGDIKDIFAELETDTERQDVRSGDLVFFLKATADSVEIPTLSLITHVSPSLKSLAVVGSRVLETETAKFPLRQPYEIRFRSTRKWFESVKQLEPVPAVRPASHRVQSFYLTPGNNSELVKSVLESLGYRRASSQLSASLIWTQLVRQIDSEKLGDGRKLVNHLPKLTLLITTKKAIRHTTKLIPGFPVPVTYDLSDRFDYMSFMRVISSPSAPQKWILKPFSLNQGIGISLISNLPQFRKDLQSGHESREKVIQQYISNPLLLNGHKFDIRYYILIARCRPMFIFRYEDYYIRRSLNPFDLRSGDLLTHLTNAHQQKSHPAFEEQKESSIWSKGQFTEAVGAEIAEKIEMDIQTTVGRLFAFIGPQVEQRMGSFELLGLDFMADESRKVYLLEANTNPALYTDTEVLAAVIPAMLREALLVVTRAHTCNIANFADGTAWRQVFPIS